MHAFWVGIFFPSPPAVKFFAGEIRQASKNISKVAMTLFLSCL